jgi:hypothetical protein
MTLDFARGNRRNHQHDLFDAALGWFDGAAVVGDAIHVAGGGPMNGGAFQTSVHEVFTF